MIRKCYKFYTLIMTLMWVMAAMTASAFAVDDMWTVANRIIVDLQQKKLHPKKKMILLRRERKKRNCTKRRRNFWMQRRI